MFTEIVGFLGSEHGFLDGISMQEFHIDATAMHVMYYCDVCFSKLGGKDQMQKTKGFDFPHVQSVPLSSSYKGLNP